MAKKYLSKIKKNGSTIYLKDEEAREAISRLNPSDAEPVSSATQMWNNFNY